LNFPIPFFIKIVKNVSGRSYEWLVVYKDGGKPYFA